MGDLHTLANGARVYIDPMPSLETAALGVWARAGSIDETQAEHGVAHLLEHMAFKGTKTRSARQIAEEIESVGGYLNAATSHQRTGYYARLLRDDIPLGLDIIADILRNPAFVPQELEKEKEVVIQEIGEAADTPDDVVFELLQSLSWGEHPLARPILGTPDTVRAQSGDSLRGFMARGYGPEQLIIGAAGAVDASQFLKLCEDRFGDLKSAANASDRTNHDFVGGARQETRDTEQTHFAIAFPGVSARDPDYFATRLFADALGGGMSSRLFQSIREERGLAYSVYAFADSYDRNGLVGAYVGADGDQILETARLIRTEIEAMTKNTGGEEIDRARAMLRASLMMSLESPASRLESAAGQLFTFGRTMTPKEILERLDAVGTDDVCRCAARALSGQSAVAIVGAGPLDAVAAAINGT